MNGSTAQLAEASTQGDLVAGRYHVVRELARGGMGVVYHVRDEATGEARVLKRLLADRSNQPKAVTWFEREFRVFGLPFPSMRERMDELERQVETIHRLWSPDDPTREAPEAGDPLDARQMLPRSVQAPHPPRSAAPRATSWRSG